MVAGAIATANQTASPADCHSCGPLPQDMSPLISPLNIWYVPYCYTQTHSREDAFKTRAQPSALTQPSSMELAAHIQSWMRYWVWSQNHSP